MEWNFRNAKIGKLFPVSPWAAANVGASEWVSGKAITIIVSRMTE